MSQDLDQRKKISKSHQTFDYSDLEYSPQRKGSGDSLESQKSFESHQSADAHLGGASKESSFKGEPSPLGKQWSSTSTTSETMSETGATRSAPPITSERFSKFQSSEEGENGAKQPMHRSQGVVGSARPAVKRNSR